MSDPIRRVGGAPGLPGAADVGGAEGSGEAFRAALDATREADATGGARATDPASLASALRAGEIEPSAVVEKLVERALSTPAAHTLTEAGRADLERALRTALAEDPTLLAMQADLARR